MVKVSGSRVQGDLLRQHVHSSLRGPRLPVLGAEEQLLNLEALGGVMRVGVEAQKTVCHKPNHRVLGGCHTPGFERTPDLSLSFPPPGGLVTLPPTILVP